MTGLDSWLTQATRDLATASAAQVRREITEHYEAARDAALTGGATPVQADESALNALGDARTANRQYRHVLLTSVEARILHEGNWEARTVCSRPWLKCLFLTLPLAAMAAAALLFFAGRIGLARDVLISGLGMAPLLSAPLLPLYTASRARAFRLVKWLALSGALVILFAPDTLKWSWLLMSCLWPLAWIEWTRASIRRKLPITAWPKHLYL